MKAIQGQAASISALRPSCPVLMRYNLKGKQSVPVCDTFYKVQQHRYITLHVAPWAPVIVKTTALLFLRKLVDTYFIYNIVHLLLYSASHALFSHVKSRERNPHVREYANQHYVFRLVKYFFVNRFYIDVLYRNQYISMLTIFVLSCDTLYIYSNTRHFYKNCSVVSLAVPHIQYNLHIMSARALCLTQDSGSRLQVTFL